MAVPEQAVSPTAAAGPRLEGHGLRSWYIDAAGKVETDLSPRALAAVRASGAGSLWVDIDTTQPHQVACLENVFGFHPLSVEDTLNPNSRVKLEEFPHYLFLIVRGVAYAEHTDEPYDTETFNLCFFLGQNFLVTTHGGVAPGVEDMASRLRRSPDLLGRGAQRLMHALVDSAVDAYFPVVEKIDDFLDGLEQRVFTKFDEAALHALSWAELHALCREFGVPALIVTLGSAGCLVSEPHGHLFIAAHRGLSVVDTTGAGDAFCGGFAAGLVRHDGDIAAAARLGSAVAALSITKSGTARAMPTQSELRRFLRTVAMRTTVRRPSPRKPGVTPAPVAAK